MVSENAMTQVHGSCSLQVMGYFSKVYNTVVILIELYKCPTLLILQNIDRIVFVSKQTETSDVKVFFCILFLDLKNKQKSAKIMKNFSFKMLITTQKQAHIIFPQIKRLPSNKHPPLSKHPPLGPTPFK